MNNSENIARFEELLTSIQRDGMEKLIHYIRKTDFYYAPASTKYHLSCEGGLLQHSLNVYDCLIAKRESPFWKKVLKDISDESLILIALLHDICKTGFYTPSLKNQKTYEPDKVAAADAGQVKHDAQGDFVWESVRCYQIDDQLPLGHGEKSVMMVLQFIKLTTAEAMAIRWHMGFSEEKGLYNALGQAMEKYPIVIAIHEADLEASKIVETR